MNIFKEIKNSIYNPEYYKSVVLVQPFRVSVKYLAKLSFIASLVGVIVFSFSIPDFYDTLKKLVHAEVANYPDDLVVSIKGGNASINKPEPYSLKMSSSSQDLSDSKDPKIDNLVVIDTTKPFDLDAFRSYSTLALLTKTDLIMPKDSKGSIQIIPLSKVKDTQITKTHLTSLEVKIIKFLPAIMGLVLIFVYIGIFIGHFIGTLFILLLYGLLIWLLGKLRGVDLTYKKSYQVGIHASTVIILLSILGLFVPALRPFFIKLVAILLIVYINLFPDTKKPEKVEIPA